MQEILLLAFLCLYSLGVAAWRWLLSNPKAGQLLGHGLALIELARRDDHARAGLDIAPGDHRADAPAAGAPADGRGAARRGVELRGDNVGHVRRGDGGEASSSSSTRSCC